MIPNTCTALFFLAFFSRHVYGEVEVFASCGSHFECGNISVRYPFWGNNQASYCGHPQLKLDCRKDNITVITIMSMEYHVVGIDQQNGTLKIARMDLVENICPAPLASFHNTSLDFSLFDYTNNDENATLLYDCDVTENHEWPNEFACPVDNVPRDAYFLTPRIQKNDLASRCNISVWIPVLAMAVTRFMKSELTVDQVIDQGFEVRWNIDPWLCLMCLNSSGTCGYNQTLKQFRCFCRDRDYAKFCPPANRPPPAPGTARDDGPSWARKLGIGFGSGVGGIALTCAIFMFYLRCKRKQKYDQPSPLSRGISFDSSSVMDPEKGDSLPGVHQYTYKELEEATNKFDSNKELGDGGFGTVYYGKLKDGRAVAVKRLYENNYKRVEQFWNEVVILARLRHKNLVSLYGYTSRHSRELLLVYEFISNGTVADHLHGDHAKPGALPWSTRLKIAIETANALTYLHACDIIHRDVKTNNILLDENFCVKVADFGLSRLFPTDVTHVSTAPQGTPGYVDPEYHECYHLTDKSDVFSFGVVLMELISSKPAVDITRHRHEINLSTMAINKIQNGALHELVDPYLGFESDYKTRKMIYAVAEVAFKCLQSGKDMRPTMGEVLEALKDIQNEDYSKETSQVADTPADEAVLLKNGPQTLSPDSVTLQWISGSSTSNASN